MTQAKPPQRKSGLLTIFLTVFIDMLGVGIIIPVIPVLFFEEGSAIFGQNVSETYRSVLYGLLIASFPAMQFFGAPMLGSLSDKYGRKPVLIISLIGYMVGYLLFGAAILTKNIGLLFFSRMLPGFSGGNIAVVYSAIADISDEKSKPRNFGLVGMAFGLGFILGPAIGGLLADSTVVSWFDSDTPFWFTAILTFLNILFVIFRFSETLKERRERKVSPWTGIRNIGLSFQRPNLRVIFAVVLLLSLGFSFFTQFYSVYLITEFDYTEKSIGLLYGWIGIWLVITQGLIVRKLSNYFRSTQLLNFSILLLSLSIGSLLLPSVDWWFYVLNPIVAIGQGITAPNLTAVVSSQTSTERQGEVLGINQSMQSLGQAIPPVIAGYIHALNEQFPLLAAAGLTFLGWAVYVFVFRQSKRR